MNETKSSMTSLSAEMAKEVDFSDMSSTGICTILNVHLIGDQSHCHN